MDLCTFENRALHYLCRPAQLRQFERRFFSKREVVNTSTAKRNGDIDIMFLKIPNRSSIHLLLMEET
jgi:hypothetical protein